MKILRTVPVMLGALLVIPFFLMPAKAAERCGGKPLPTLCQLGKQEADFTVRSSKQLRSALKKIRRGGVIRVRAGAYKGSFKLSQKGSASKPLVVRGDRGAVFKDVVFRLSGKYGVLMGMTFDNGQVEIFGDNNRVARNRFIRGKKGCHECKYHAAVSIERGGRYNRVDHNEITNWKRRGFRITELTRRNRCNRIDHNYIHNLTDRFKNGREAIQIGSSNEDYEYSPKAYIQYNLIDNYKLEREIISLKSNDNVVSHNTFINSKSSGITIRTGSQNTIKNNVMKNTSGIIVYADDNMIIGNDLYNSDIRVASGDCQTAEMGIKKGGKLRYQGCHPASDHAIIAGNDLRRGARIEIGERFGGTTTSNEYPRRIPAIDTKVGNNGKAKIRFLGPHKKTNVKFKYRGSIGKAKELRPRDVGPSAKDRFCD